MYHDGVRVRRHMSNVVVAKDALLTNRTSDKIFLILMLRLDVLLHVVL